MFLRGEQGFKKEIRYKEHYDELQDGPGCSWIASGIFGLIRDNARVTREYSVKIGECSEYAFGVLLLFEEYEVLLSDSLGQEIGKRSFHSITGSDIPCSIIDRDEEDESVILVGFPDPDSLPYLCGDGRYFFAVR